MNNLLSIRIKIGPAARWTMALVLAAAWPVARGAENLPQPSPAATAIVLDQVIAVVNKQPILASDVDDEMRLATLNPGQGRGTALTPERALEQLISRALIEQQIRQEDEQATEPSAEEVQARIKEIREELPACVRFHCASEQGWKLFLAAHELTPQQVEAYLRNRIQVLSFIELRFRQGIRISPEEISAYYQQTLRPEYAPGELIPPLSKVAPRIQEILLEQQVNVLFDNWLDSLRKQGDVEVLDPEFKISEDSHEANPGQTHSGKAPSGATNAPARTAHPEKTGKGGA